MKQARRLDNAPPYLFVEIENKIKEAQKKGVDVINLGIGDPDIPTPDFIVNKAIEAIKNPTYHCYPEYDGCIEYRSAVARYYKRRFGVELDPENEIVALLGSKEGIAHIFFALVNDGDFTLVPDPQYPVYRLATSLTGGIPYPMPLIPENGFLPDFSMIPIEVLKRTKILFINYPNNPTGVVANLDFYKKVIEIGKKYEILICNDNAYSEFTYDGVVAPSLLQVEGAMDTAIEFHSLSKSYNMTGWRLGYAVGNSDAIAKLKKMKHNIDSGIFTALQVAGIEALDNGDSFIKNMVKIYERRKDYVLGCLDRLGWEYVRPEGAFYIWVKAPGQYSSSEFASLLLKKYGIVVAPGNGYGDYGEGYIRISLTISDERLKEAFERVNSNPIGK
ncbi:MAG: LL-diaminopimelate aminotransferase [Petroclostridium sp.]|jgi:LL-diaminopimelate aminotransferase|nr:aspartate/tyrosine/aromatic aminotransferase [Clostridia bacterium]MDK2810293.1 LL-diaminopimelate aminotransferase [Petroclostridium sp.]